MFNRPNSFIGVGINHRNQINQDILEHIDKIDCIEVYTEKFFIKDHDEIFKTILKKVPLILHGLDLSIGSADEIDSEYINNLQAVLCNTTYEWFSEHISLTKEDNTEVGHLMPIQFTDECCFNIVSKAKKINSLSLKPFLLENITYYYQMPGSTLNEAQFISKILNQADCGMLLDINNLYINAKNHNYDPFEFLDMIPVDRVVEIHLAGGSFKYNMLVDTHANPVSNEVWNLFEQAIKKVPFNCVIIERDSNLPRYSDLLEEVSFTKSLLRKHGILLSS